MDQREDSKVRDNPGDFLSAAVGRPVQVKLNSGVLIKGSLVCLDGYMNIVLEKVEEYMGVGKVASYGEAFIRGNNGKKNSTYWIVMFIKLT